MDPNTLKMLKAAQTATQSALDALMILQQLNPAITAMVQENRGPNAAELAHGWNMEAMSERRLPSTTSWR